MFLKSFFTSVVVLFSVVLLSLSVGTGKLNGLVQNSQGEALEGVTIVNETLKKIAKTDSNGAFEIEARTNDQIKFLLAGYESKTIIYRNQSEIKVILKERLEEAKIKVVEQD